MIGSKNYTTMKKYIKIYALLAMALFVGACEDELGNSFEPVQIVSGEEIIFGASYRSASADKAPADRTTRTAYGETNTDKSWIEINWIPEYDRMQIASPQSVGVANGVAEYKVQASKDSETNGGESTVTELVRTGAAGLQWGPIDEGTVYDFYAVYPSVNQLRESSASAAADGCSLTNKGILTGYLPTDQTCTDPSKVTGSNFLWSFTPEMNYAYMVAKSSYTVDSFDEEGAAFMDEPINLQFESLVTALQFQLKAGNLKLPNAADDDNKIEIVSVAVFSQSGLQLAGDFEYDIKADGTEDEGLVKPGTNTYSQVIQKFNGFGTPVILNNDPSSALDLTFFLLPSVENYTSGDLKLQVVYVIDGVTQVKTATIGTDIPARVKRYFKDVVLPSHTTDVDASVWFQALNPNILVSQVSIPVAANAFANKAYVSGLSDYNTQQAIKIDTLWNLGVRGFEICVDWEPNSNSSTPNKDKDDKSDIENNHNLDKRYIIASEHATNVTFASQLDLLHEKMFETDEEGNKTTVKTNEPLVLIVTFQPRAEGGSGYNPYYFLYNLMNSMKTFCQRHGYKDVDDIFVQLNSTMTVKDLYGKIALIVRPCSDERWAYETYEFQRYTSFIVTLTDYRPCYNPLTLLGINSVTNDNNTDYVLSDVLATKIPEDLRDNLLFIKDWGMDSWDSWHRRFGKGNYYHYASTATNKVKIEKASRTPVSGDLYEDVLLGNTSNPSFGFDYYYDHGMHNGGTAYVQDMVRIANGTFSKSLTVNNTTYNVTWESSIDEKKKAIDGLFKKSVDVKNYSSDNNIYINNLSGYFITDSLAASWYPAYYIGYNDDKNEVFPGNSKGGDYKACADVLTEYVYGILSGKNDMASGGKLAEGPWGLVMMDYVGSAKNSKELVNLIMMNNFAGFKLAEKQDQNKDPQLVKVTLNDEKVNPEAEVFVTWN